MENILKDNKLKIISTLLLALFTFSSNAAFHCYVDVNRVLVYDDGSVNVLHAGRDDFTYICNLKGTWKNIDTVTCSMWVSLLQNAQNQQKKVTFYYRGEGDCATLPTYSSAPAPQYIGTRS